MDKFVATIVIVGLVLFVYLGVFQNGLNNSVTNKGTAVDGAINNTQVTTP